MLSYDLNPSIIIVWRRCRDCGRFYGVERDGPPTDCPVCAWRKRDAQCSHAASLERKIAALRGALTRAKRRANGT